MNFRNTILAILMLFSLYGNSQQPIDSIKDKNLRKMEGKLWDYADTVNKMGSAINLHISWGIIPISIINDDLQYLDSCRDITNKLKILYFKAKDTANINRIMSLQLYILHSKNILDGMKNGFIPN